MSEYPFHFQNDGTFSISATTTSANGALKGMSTGKNQIRVHNAGSATVFIRKGTDNTIAATTADMPVPSGAVEVLTINNPDKTPVTYMAAITASGTATVYITTGWGI